MDEEFAKSLYETVIEDGIKTYRDLYESTEATTGTIDYWKNALELYRSLDEGQKEALIDIVEQTMIDTVSSVLGILDGSGALSGKNFDFDVQIDGVSTEGELQDSFLSIAEENRASRT